MVQWLHGSTSTLIAFRRHPESLHASILKLLVLAFRPEHSFTGFCSLFLKKVMSHAWSSGHLPHTDAEPDNKLMQVVPLPFDQSAGLSRVLMRLMLQVPCEILDYMTL